MCMQCVGMCMPMCWHVHAMHMAMYTARNARINVCRRQMHTNVAVNRTDWYAQNVCLFQCARMYINERIMNCACEMRRNLVNPIECCRTKLNELECK